MFETAWFFSTWDLHIPMTPMAAGLEWSEACRCKELVYATRRCKGCSISVRICEAAGTMVPKGWRKIMLGKNFDNASSGFLFCVLILLCFAVLWVPGTSLALWLCWQKYRLWPHVFLRCWFFGHQQIFRWCFGLFKQAASFSWETHFLAPWRDSN